MSIPSRDLPASLSGSEARSQRRRGFLREFRAFARVIGRGAVLLGMQLTLVFALFSLAPGDPARTYLGPAADASAVAALRARMGYDAPLLVRYTRFVVDGFTADFGYSFSKGGPAWDHLRRGLARSLRLAAITLCLALMVALASGLLDALAPHLRGHLLRGMDLISTVPGFILTLLCTVPVLRFHPGILSPADSWLAYVPPAAAVAISPSALLASQLLDGAHRVQLSEMYLCGRAFGCSRIYLFCSVTLPSLLFGWLESVKNLLAGIWLLTLVAEFIFSIAGLSSLMVEGIQFKDLPLLQGFVVINCVVFTLAGTVIDLARQAVRPR